MIQCKNKCPLDKFNGCCVQCPEYHDCMDSCEERPDSCDDSIMDEESGLQIFRQSNFATLENIASLEQQKKAIEDQEKTMKTRLYESMMRCGVKKFESDVLNLTLVLPTISTTIDTAKLKKKYPDIAAECSKTSERAGYVKITLKGGNRSD